MIHSFWVPALRYKHDAIPGSTQVTTLTFSRGELPGQCAEFCGLRHSDMVFTAHAVRPAQFLAWARSGGRSPCRERRHRPSRARAPLGGWIGALTSTDHKRIGLNLGRLPRCSSSCVGGVMALLMRTQLAQPNMQFVSDNSYNELFTMHGSTMIYLFVTPMAMAMAMYLVPLQIGALGSPAPRLALAGLVDWLCGGLMMRSGC